MIQRCYLIGYQPHPPVSYDMETGEAVPLPTRLIEAGVLNDIEWLRRQRRIARDNVGQDALLDTIFRVTEGMRRRQARMRKVLD